jgi:hypothetical protein
MVSAIVTSARPALPPSSRDPLAAGLHGAKVDAASCNLAFSSLRFPHEKDNNTMAIMPKATPIPLRKLIFCFSSKAPRTTATGITRPLVIG